jgi:hypothetical protein
MVTISSHTLHGDLGTSRIVEYPHRIENALAHFAQHYHWIAQRQGETQFHRFRHVTGARIPGPMGSEDSERNGRFIAQLLDQFSSATVVSP